MPLFVFIAMALRGLVGIWFVSFSSVSDWECVLHDLCGLHFVLIIGLFVFLASLALPICLGIRLGWDW